METKRWNWSKGGWLLLLVVALASPVLGQSVTASVTGTVTDNTGAVLKAAAVVAVNQSYPGRVQGPVERRGRLHDLGLAASAATWSRPRPQGFKSVTTNPITLETGQVARVNLKLELGAVSEQVEVVGVNPILQTENAVVGEVISGTTVVALPLNGRNFAQLALLAPGVQTHAPDSFTEANPTVSSGRPYVNGQREQSNNFMLDGVDQNEAVDNQIAYYPSPDAIAEMRVETNNYSAEFGNVAGGVVSAVTKSGSNEFHGGAFVFARNDSFDANSLGEQPVRREEGRLHAADLRRDAGRPAGQEQAVLLRELPGHAGQPPRRGGRLGGAARVAQRGLLEPARERHRDQRPPDRLAVPRQHHPREPLQPPGPGDPRQHHELPPAQPPGARRQLREQPRLAEPQPPGRSEARLRGLAEGQRLLAGLPGQLRLPGHRDRLPPRLRRDAVQRREEHGLQLGARLQPDRGQRPAHRLEPDRSRQSSPGQRPR